MEKQLTLEDYDEAASYLAQCVKIHGDRFLPFFQRVYDARGELYRIRAAVELEAGMPIDPKLAQLVEALGREAARRDHKRGSPLPKSLPPRGLNREEAAAYIGVSTTKFDDMVQDGRMPKPKRIDSRRVWDLRKLDSAFDKLPGDEGPSSDEDDWSVSV